MSSVLAGELADIFGDALSLRFSLLQLVYFAFESVTAMSVLWSVHLFFFVDLALQRVQRRVVVWTQHTAVWAVCSTEQLATQLHQNMIPDILYFEWTYA